MKNLNDRIQNINRIFTHLELLGVDTNQPFLYSYFFVDKDNKELENLSLKLKELSFDNQGSIYKTEDNLYQLHLEKTETHTKESLLKKLSEFDELAKNEKVKLFDGWDIGNADITKPLISKEDFEIYLGKISISSLYNYAVELLENEIYDKAIIAFDKCIELDIEIENSLYKQFICFDYLEDVENVLLKLNEVLNINPNHFKACYNIGAISYDLENFEQSINYYEKASKINSNDDSVFYGIALSQYCLGNMTESEINSKKALEINPKNQNAKQLLNMIKQ